MGFWDELWEYGNWEKIVIGEFSRLQNSKITTDNFLVHIFRNHVTPYSISEKVKTTIDNFLFFSSGFLEKTKKYHWQIF